MMTAQQLELRAQRLKERELAEKERSNLVGETLEEQKVFNDSTTMKGKGVIPNIANLITSPGRAFLYAANSEKIDRINKNSNRKKDYSK